MLQYRDVTAIWHFSVNDSSNYTCHNTESSVHEPCPDMIHRQSLDIDMDEEWSVQWFLLTLTSAYDILDKCTIASIEPDIDLSNIGNDHPRSCLLQLSVWAYFAHIWSFSIYYWTVPPITNQSDQSCSDIRPEDVVVLCIAHPHRLWIGRNRRMWWVCAIWLKRSGNHWQRYGLVGMTG